MPYLFKRKWCYQNNYYNDGDIVMDLTRREQDALYSLPEKVRNEIVVQDSVDELTKLKERRDKKNKKKEINNDSTL